MEEPRVIPDDVAKPGFNIYNQSRNGGERSASVKTGLLSWTKVVLPNRENMKSLPERAPHAAAVLYF
jgi:hypothetical protein